MSLITEKKHSNIKYASASRFYIFSAAAMMFFFLFADINSVSAKNFTIFNALNVNQPYFTVNGTTGNVGVGMTNPAYKLDVSGDVRATTNFRSSSNNIILSDTSGTAFRSVMDTAWADNASTRFFQVGASNANIAFTAQNGTIPARTMINGAVTQITSGSYITSNVPAGIFEVSNGTNGLLNVLTGGNVGIGTTNPGATLDISGAIASIRAKSATISNIGSGLIMADASGNLYSTSSAAATGIPSPSGINGQTLRSNGTNWIANNTLYNNGTNVGIGTTTPGSKLQVETSVAGPIATFKNTSNNYGGLVLRMDNSTQANSRNWGMFTDAGAFGNLSFAPSINSTSTPIWSDAKITFNKDGNVGIGTTNPLNPLHVYSNNPTGLLFERSTAQNSNIQYKNPNGSMFAGISPGANFAIGNSVDLSTAYLTVLNSGGNVGVGLVNPGATLDVGGTVASFRAKSATISNIGSGLIMADASGNLYSTSSAAATGIPSPSGITGQTLRSDGTNWIANNTLYNNGTNVGIGTTNPNNKLHVVGGAGGATSLATAVTNAAMKLDYAGNPGIGMYSGFINSGGGAYQYIQAANINGSTAYNLSLNPYGGNVGVGTTTPSSKMEIVGGALRLSGSYLDINRIASAASGINWYSQSNNAWVNYMSATGAGMGPKGNLTAPAGNFVNSWALRSFIENVAGYGWTFESGTLNATTSVVKFEIRSSDGTFHSYGNGLIDGNVGVGTTNPGATVDIAGATASFRAKSATLSNIGAGLIMADASGNLYSTSSAAATGIPSPSGITGQTLRSNGTSWVANNLLFNDGTNVGIGTTNPNLAKFQIEAGDGVVGQYINGGTTVGTDLLKLRANAANQRLILEGAGGTVQTFLEAGGSIGLFGTVTNHDFRIRTNYVDRMTFDTAGNVGIGTTTPAQKLDVLGNIRANGMVQSLQPGGNSYMFTMDATNGAGPRLQLGTLASQASFFEIGAYGSINNFDSKNRDLKLYTNNGFLYLNSTSGNIGIATTTPGATFDINGAIASFRAKSATLSNIGAGLIMADASGNLYSTSTAAATGIPSPSGISGQTLRSNGTNWIANNLLYNNGTNVGIGTTAPIAKLDVNGNINATSFFGRTFSSKTTAYFNVGTYYYLFSVNPPGNGQAGSGDFEIYGNGSYQTVKGTITAKNAGGVSSAELHIYSSNTSNYTIVGYRNPDNYTIDFYFTPLVSVSYTESYSASNLMGSAFINSSPPASPAANTFVWSSGKIGIGTGNPAAALHVFGDGTNSAVLMNGNVGIGTTAPTRPLDVASNVVENASGSASQLTVRGTGSSTYKLNVGYDTTLNFGFIEAVNESSSWLNLILQPRAGNVGIGTTNPGTTLDVGGTIASFRAKSATLSNIGAGLIMADASGNLYSTSTAAATGIPSPSGISGQTLRSDGTNWIANNLLYNNGTNVGVGITTPGGKLSTRNGANGWPVTSGATQTYGALRVEGGNNAVLDFGNNSTSGSWIQSTDKASLGTNYPLILQPNGGNVGIGITNPGSYKLNVVGNTFLNGTLTASSSISTVNGDITAARSGSYANLVVRSSNDVAWQGSRVEFNRSRGLSTAKTSVANGDTIGWFDYFAYDGITDQRVAQFQVNVDGAVSSGIIPGKFSIITADSAGASKTRLTAYANDNILMAPNGGNVGIGAATYGATLDVGGSIGSFRSKSATISNIGAGLIMADASGNLYSTSTAAATGIPSPSGIAGQTLRSNGTNWIANNLLYNNGTNVGIGTTSPQQLLDVNGVINAGSTAVAGEIRSVQGSGSNLYVSLKSEYGSGTNKSGIFRSNAGYFLYYDTGTGDIAMDVNYAGASNIFKIGGVEKMRVANSGNVGIGTSNPNLGKLQVAGITTVVPVAGSQLSFEASSANTPRIQSYNSQPLYINELGNNTLFNINSGNVGVGTINPGATLDVGGTVASFRAKSATLSNIGAGLIMADASGNLYSTTTAAATGIPSPSGISGYTLRSNGTNWIANNLLFNNGTNIGIGTTTPGYKLDVASGDWTQARFKSTSTGYAPASILLQADYDSSRGQGLYMYNSVATENWFAGIPYSTNSDRYTIAYKSSATFDNSIAQLTNSLLTIKKDGSVGIGTSNPTQKLEVTGNALINPNGSAYLSVGKAFSFNGYNGIGGGMGSNVYYDGSNWRYMTSGPGNLYWGGGSGEFGFYTISSGTAGNLAALNRKMVLSNAGGFSLGSTYVNTDPGANNMIIEGNVGIGTTSTGATLDVGGAIASFRAKSATLSNIGSGLIMADASGNLYSTSTAAATGIPSPSGINGYTLRSNGTNWIGNNLLFNDGTNIGIGTTNPRYSLEVNGKIINTAAYNSNNNLGQYDIGVSNLGIGSALYSYGYICSGNSSAACTGTGGVVIGTANSTANVSISNTGNSFFNVGNIGVGTTNPTQKLHVVGTFHTTGLNTLDSNLVFTQTSSARNVGTVGTYSPNSLAAIWSMGAAYQLTATGTPGNLYGLSYSYEPDYGGAGNNPGAISGLGHQMQWRSNGATQTAIGTGIYTAGNVGIGVLTTGATLDVGGALASFRAKSATLSNIGAGIIMADASGNLFSTTSPSFAGGTMTGDLNMNGYNILNVNKLNVNTIDPLYNIRGTKYSTYASSISGGVKEEYVGKVTVNSLGANKEYEKVIDFANEPEGTDLWVWRQVIDFNSDNVEVLITPYGRFANAYYLIKNNQLIFRSDKPVTLSYRLIGRRFDWRQWPTRATDQAQTGGLEIR